MCSVFWRSLSLIGAGNGGGVGSRRGGVVRRHLPTRAGAGAWTGAKGGGGEPPQQNGKKSGRGDGIATPPIDCMSVSPSGASASDAIGPKHTKYLPLIFDSD